MPSSGWIKCSKQVGSTDYRLFVIPNAMDTFNDDNVYNLIYFEQQKITTFAL